MAAFRRGAVRLLDLRTACAPRSFGNELRGVRFLCFQHSSCQTLLQKDHNMLKHRLPFAAYERSMSQVASRRVKLDYYLSTPGVIAEPYRVPPPPLPFVQRWFSKEGWRIRKKGIMDMVKTAYTLAKLRQKIKGYSQKMFYREASDLYKQINTLAAAGDIDKLRRLVTETFLSVMKSQIKQRKAVWDHVQWEMVGSIKLMRTLQARLIAVDKENLDNAFVQVTIRIQSHQLFAAYDKDSNVIAGDVEKPLLVEDVWVLERHLVRPDSAWRLCGQLTLKT